MRLISFITFVAVLPLLFIGQDTRASTAKDIGSTAELVSLEFFPAVPMPAAALAADTALTRVAFGSCYHPSLESGIFNEIAGQHPDAFVFLGDNVYAEDESDDPTLMSLRQAYANLSAVESFKALRKSTPLLVAWDDHDYGKDDAGGDFKHREFSESLYTYAWNIEQSDERTSRPGVYLERTVGPVGKRVQFITLDTRSFRTSLTRHPDQDIGRYVESQDPNQNVLGETQWKWLAEQLRRPADIRIIVTPIQLIADGHHWESWRIMPAERERLYRLLSSSKANGVVVVSGDRHSAAIYALTEFEPYPLYELTTSSLNVPLTSFVKNPVDEPGPHRLINPYYESNYGLIDIDWDAGELSMKLMDESSQLIAEQIIRIDSLRP
ncbi:MAG: alkaline phosphatase family protein [Gammaproteobacteria bacterium]|jgi:alkaline phosphatase D|nr:alkaline phosphatase family protein [Gammaproteobacteria bacterium]MDG1231710.1 alkaline phosphatase D family protein [Pseudomonadales bacterium]